MQAVIGLYYMLYVKFIDYMFDDKTVIDYTNLLSPHDFKNNDKIIKDIIINQKI